MYFGRKCAVFATCRYWQSGKSSVSGVHKTAHGICCWLGDPSWRGPANFTWFFNR